MSTGATFRRLGASDVRLLRDLNILFGEAFDDRVTYGEEPPTDAYLEHLLSNEQVIALVALVGDEVAGGLVAYELDKFERMRREVYIYDLAVAARHRRRRIATTLIEQLCEIAAKRGASTVYVQAHRGDTAAVALYSKLGICEETLHFDIEVEPEPR